MSVYSWGELYQKHSAQTVAGGELTYPVTLAPSAGIICKTPELSFYYFPITMPPAPAPLIDTSHVAFIQGAVGISVAASNHGGRPALVRAIGCHVAADRLLVTIFLSAIQATQLIGCVRRNGAVAVVFSEPSTHRIVQLKGAGAVVEGLLEGEWEQVQAYREAFMRELAPLGFDPGIVRTLLAHRQADIVALRFTPSEAYSRTPSPQAGAPLKADT